MAGKPLVGQDCVQLQVSKLKTNHSDNTNSFNWQLNIFEAEDNRFRCKKAMCVFATFVLNTFCLNVDTNDPH